MNCKLFREKGKDGAEMLSRRVIFTCFSFPLLSLRKKSKNKDYKTKF